MTKQKKFKDKLAAVRSDSDEWSKRFANRVLDIETREKEYELEKRKFEMETGQPRGSLDILDADYAEPEEDEFKKIYARYCRFW